MDPIKSVTEEYSLKMDSAQYYDLKKTIEDYKGLLNSMPFDADYWYQDQIARVEGLIDGAIKTEIVTILEIDDDMDIPF